VDKDTKKYHLQMALPSVDPNKVELNLQGNMLTISAERKASREAKDVDYLHREFSYGTFRRTLTLPEGVETEKINAEYNNGLLEITAPMAGRSVAAPGRDQGPAKGRQGCVGFSACGIASPEPLVFRAFSSEEGSERLVRSRAVSHPNLAGYFAFAASAWNIARGEG